MTSPNEKVETQSNSVFTPNVLTYEQITETLTNVVDHDTVYNVGVCGIDVGADSSAVAYDLAQTLSLSSHKVLLVKVHDVGAGKGSGDFKARVSELLKKTGKNYSGGVVTLDVALSDLPRPASPQEAVFVDTVQVLEQEFSVILWDLPPVDKAAQTRMIAQYTQGVILVVEAGQTRWQTTRYAMEHLRFSDCKILGVILNKKKNYIPNWLYKLLFRDV